MSALSSIEWTDRTWNPVRGCSLVSPGCVNCYAMKFAHRFNRPGGPYEGLTKATSAGPQWTGNVQLVESALREPLSWRKPARVFVNSMSDLFHESVPDDFIDRVFAVMALVQRHTFQILTKRPSRMLSYLSKPERRSNIAFDVRKEMDGWPKEYEIADAVESGETWPLPNVWLGVSCEDQQRADERIAILLETPAAVRFISAEPLLGPIMLHDSMFRCCRSDKCDESVFGLDWVIVGGESGPNARPCDIEWIRSIVKHCKVPGVPVFVKQLGSRSGSWAQPSGVTDPERERWMRDGWTRVLGKDGESFSKHLRLRDRKGGDPAEWPDDLRVREFPRECDALRRAQGDEMTRTIRHRLTGAVLWEGEANTVKDTLHAATKECVVCGTVFVPHPTKRARAKTCSKVCRYALLSKLNSKSQRRSSPPT